MVLSVANEPTFLRQTEQRWLQGMYSSINISIISQGAGIAITSSQLHEHNARRKARTRDRHRRAFTWLQSICSLVLGARVFPPALLVGRPVLAASVLARLFLVPGPPLTSSSAFRFGAAFTIFLGLPRRTGLDGSTTIFVLLPFATVEVASVLLQAFLAAVLGTVAAFRFVARREGSDVSAALADEEAFGMVGAEFEEESSSRAATATLDKRAEVMR